MKIRIIRQQDFDAWSALRKKLWTQTDDEENLEELKNVLANSNKFQIFLAETDSGEIIGFLEASLRNDYVEDCDFSPVGYVEGWFVEENFRRQNAGRHLVKAAENWARELGCREMASDCELENSVSLGAHLGVGFSEVNRTIHFKKNL